MTRLTIKRLITEDMGYCCLYAFFRLFRRTTMIAERLGMSRRAVLYAKAKYNAGALHCEKCPRCLLREIERAGR